MSLCATVLAGCLAAVPAPLRAAEAGSGAPFAIDPPPGWTLVSATETDASLVLALRGPEKSSFVLTRINPVGFENRAAVRGLLADVLSGINLRTRLKFQAASNLETATYGNGLTAHCIRAGLDGKPRLALAVMELNGATMLGTLVSAVPDTMLPAILGSLKATGVPVPAAAPLALSQDGQLSFRLPSGVRSRVLAPRERRAGFVAAFAGPGAEVMVMKLADDGTPVKDQPDIVKSTVRSVPGVEARTLTPVKFLMTSAGPDFIYAWARVSDASGPSLFLAGYMPWAYWGYSILARGPAAPDLTAELFGSLSLGPSAVPKLVAASPRLPITRRLSLLSPWTSTATLVLLLAAAAWFWWRNRGN